MSLFETGEFCQAHPGEFSCGNSIPQGFTKIFLERAEFHLWSIAGSNSLLLLALHAIHPKRQ